MDRGAAVLVINDRDVRAELADVRGLERADLELDHDVVQVLNVEEDQVDVKLLDLVAAVVRHAQPHLATIFGGLPEGDKLVEIASPHNESIELIELRTDDSVSPVESTRPVWIHHGSSISHGSNASTPTQIWPAVSARLGGVELRNLGFGGGALVDPFLARVIRDAPADLISVKLGIDVVNLDSMRLRAFVPAVHGFLDTIRDGHPHHPARAHLADLLRHPRGHPRPGRRRPGHPRHRPGPVHRNRPQRRPAAKAPHPARHPRSPS